MKELQELRNYILGLKNMGVIKKTTEITLLHKLNALEKQFAISVVVKSFYCKTERCDKTKNNQCDECALKELNDMQ